MLLRATTRDAKNPVQGKVKRNLSNNRGLPFHEAEIKVLRWPLIAIYSSLVGRKHEREPKNPPHWWACNTNNANALHKINQQAPQGFIYLFIFTPNSYNNGRKGIQTLAFLIIEKSWLFDWATSLVSPKVWYPYHVLILPCQPQLKKKFVL